MTYKEAINAIKSNYPPSRYSILRKALDMAIEALEKQIPMKPAIEIYENRVKLEQQVRLCPRCGEVEFGYNQPKYCPNCGQAIDWSEVEE